MKPERESDIQKTILQYLTTILGWMMWRSNSGGMKVEERYVQFNTAKGCSDLLGVIPISTKPEFSPAFSRGRFLAIEVKRSGKKPTALQQAYLDQVRDAGGLALVATSIDDLRKQLREAGYDVPSTPHT